MIKAENDEMVQYAESEQFYIVSGICTLISLQNNENIKTIKEFYDFVEDKFLLNSIHILYDDEGYPENVEYFKHSDFLCKKGVVSEFIKIGEKKRGIEQTKNLIQYFMSLGSILRILSESKIHNKFNCINYFNIEILPPMYLSQYEVIYNDKEAFSFCTRAWLSMEIIENIIFSSRALASDEWNTGNALFFNDWASPFGGTRELISRLTNGRFKGHTAIALRRNQDGTVRSVKKLIGVAVKNEKRSGLCNINAH